MKKNSVLLVDDTPEMIDLLGETLNHDYTIKVALNGEKALKIAMSENPPDIILLDVMMQGMDGYEVCRRLKADPKTQDIPIIFITAKSDESDETRGLEIGAVDYITKPFSPPIVRARLKTHLSLRNILNELYQKNQMVNDRANELASLNRLAEKVNSSLNMHDILQAACDELVKIFDIRNAGIGLFDETREKIKVVAFRSVDPTEKDATGMEMPLKEYEATRIVIETKQPIVIKNAQTDPRTKPIHPIMRKRQTQGLLIVPILSCNQVIGTIGMPAKQKSQTFSDEDVELVKTIASQVASSIENSRLYSKIEQALDVAERDLEIGRKIQKEFFPEKMPEKSMWEIEAYFQPARQVSGDFYDLFFVDNGRHLGIVMADVCDHGVGSALFMVLFRSLIRAYAKLNFDWLKTGEGPLNQPVDELSQVALKQTIHQTNIYISSTHESSGMFATMFFGILDTETGLLNYINCGHEPPLIIGGNGIETSLKPTGLAMGLDADASFLVGQIRIDSKKTLFLYTDGATDAQNPSGEYFNKSRLLSLLEKPAKSANDLLDRVTNKIHKHVSTMDRYDDVTLLAIRRKTEE